MILNVFSTILIFIDFVSAILVSLGGVFALALYWKWGRRLTTEGRTRLEDRSYLILLIAVVVLAIRLLSWPLFYATLQSFVPEIEGAMCIFGVTQVEHGLTKFLEVLKPVVFFLIGGWLFLYAVDRATKTYPLMRRKLLFLSIASLFILTDCVGDLVLFFRISPDALVSCCTTVTDVADRPTRLVPQAFFGKRYEPILLPFYYLSNLGLMAMVGLALGRKRLEARAFRRGLILSLIFLAAVVNGLIEFFSLAEVIAPRLMGLPFHHCLYCLLRYVPDSSLMLLLFILGSFAVGWAFLISLIGAKGEAVEILPRYLKGLYGFSLITLFASLIMVSVHLLFT